MTLGNTERTWEFVQQYRSLLEDWIPRDATFAIACEGHYLYHNGKEENLKGKQVATGSIAQLVLQERRKVENFLDHSSYNEPKYGNGYPIELDGMQGALVVYRTQTSELSNPQPVRLLTGKADNEWFPIQTDRITHLESFQKKTFFYTEDGQYSIANTLKELEKKLPPSFLRIHRSYIVNTACIERISRDFSSNLQVIITDGTELPISQKYVNEVRCVLGF
ncbi:LytR/AlgR family response regulator transcription factor [Sporosarcina sp. OR05]|uniref:LytR/AlgR family response regulator transcription factor n=1 Tax=Sporosarcina sp. OR05 TaxID=2969819 RepID=UPI00352B1BF4